MPLLDTSGFGVLSESLLYELGGEPRLFFDPVRLWKVGSMRDEVDETPKVSSSEVSSASTISLSGVNGGGEATLWFVGV